MWFDSSSIANLAKNALKEGKERWKTLKFTKLLRGDFNLTFNRHNLSFNVTAQKHIDNVLDIKEDELSEALVDDPKMVKSKTMSSIQDVEKKELQDSVWGSFNGSFFDNKPSPSSPITNPPPRKNDTSSGEWSKPGYDSGVATTFFSLF